MSESKESKESYDDLAKQNKILLGIIEDYVKEMITYRQKLQKIQEMIYELEDVINKRDLNNIQ